MSLSSFHPAVRNWFERTFERPTPVQARAWPAIREGGHTLLAAPTGSGKTLAAFLSAIDDLVREGERKGLPDETRVLYVSPLKALSNDIHRNLDEPLAGIRDELLQLGKADVAITALVRTGDTPQHERTKMRRTPPHIVVTTPESLFILLTSESGRRMLSTVRTVIVDEIHAVAGSKRGAHLALSLARLDALCGEPPVRVGLSATQKPMEAVARFLTGNDDCTIVDTGHQRERDLALVLPRSPLEAVMANEVWADLYDQLAELVRAHRTTLIFANNRRQCERVARHLAERVGEEVVTSHHGSLSRKHRLDAEQRLKAGTLRALVATSSLELGIDIGDVDLVCQLGSPRSIGALLQRVGRAGHAVHATPKGRLFPLSRDDLTECVALLEAVRRGELDRLSILQRPLDVLAQQIVAEVAGREWDETALFQRLQTAWPYRDLTRVEYDAVVRMLAEGYTTRRGRRGAYLHRDAVNGRLRARRGARLTALTNGGVIPDQFDYEVVLLPEGFRIGTLNEDFAFESIPGDIFQLGNTSYRICKVAEGKVFAEDAKGQPPNIPFWFGEAPGRSGELSEVISRLRAELDRRLASGEEAALTWAREELKLEEAAARQLVDYNAASRAALTVLPTEEKIVFERFFDESGDQHLVIHAPYGSRINRAWGLVLASVLRGRRRELHCAVAGTHAQLCAGRCLALSQLGRRPRSTDASTARCPDVRDSLALERQCRACDKTELERQARAGPVPALRRRRSAGGRVPGPARLRRKLERRLSGDSRSPARAADGTRLSSRDDGCRRAGKAARAPGAGRDQDRLSRPGRALADGVRDTRRTPLCISRRRAGRGAPHAGRTAAQCAERGGSRGTRAARCRGHCQGTQGSLAGSENR
jgi:ATP-dependent Lhr-like helicase